MWPVYLPSTGGVAFLLDEEPLERTDPETEALVVGGDNPNAAS
jgi:hypothetical protein